MDELIKKKKILYITYDGLTDPLGQSQILPYIIGLEEYGYQFFILSFEKKGRLAKNENGIKALIEGKKINWVPLSFTDFPAVISKLYDAVRMKAKAEALHCKEKFDMVHCRSYIAAEVGLYLKKKYRTRFFFDMRGFWADEKKDGGSWNVANPIFRKIYRYYKQKEKEYIQQADYIISLTEAGKREISSWPFFDKKVPLKVIPCCADMNLFSLTDKDQKSLSREGIGVDRNALLLSYLGSVGTWYMLTEMLLFFKATKGRFPNSKFLFVTHSNPLLILSEAKKLGLQEHDLIIKEAGRREVPCLMKASDINVSFIKPVYSKISSSPTKIGEVLSMGIPVVCNKGVGDVKEVVERAQAGFVLDKCEEKNFSEALEAIPMLLKKAPSEIRESIINTYSLKRGVKLYLDSYKEVLD